MTTKTTDTRTDLEATYRSALHALDDAATELANKVATDDPQRGDEIAAVALYAREQIGKLPRPFSRKMTPIVETVTVTAIFTDDTTETMDLGIAEGDTLAERCIRLGTKMRRDNPKLAALDAGGYRWVGCYTDEHMRAINRFETRGK